MNYKRASLKRNNTLATSAVRKIYDSGEDIEGFLSTNLLGIVKTRSKLTPKRQAKMRKLFAAVVLAALDDAIQQNQRDGTGGEQIANWARSKDGREVLKCAGIDPNEKVVAGLVAFVLKGDRASLEFSKAATSAKQGSSSKVPSELEGIVSKVELSEDGWLNAEINVLVAQARALRASVGTTTDMISSRCEVLLRGANGGH